jgi:hypothetical protein
MEGDAREQTRNDGDLLDNEDYALLDVDMKPARQSQQSR